MAHVHLDALERQLARYSGPELDDARQAVDAACGQVSVDPTVLRISRQKEFAAAAVLECRTFIKLARAMLSQDRRLYREEYGQLRSWKDHVAATTVATASMGYRSPLDPALHRTPETAAWFHLVGQVVDAVCSRYSYCCA
jgi:hypothetical protein